MPRQAGSPFEPGRAAPAFSGRDDEEERKSLLIVSEPAILVRTLLLLVSIPQPEPAHAVHKFSA